MAEEADNHLKFLLLDEVIADDVVRCGSPRRPARVRSVDASGEHVGFDADFCRVDRGRRARRRRPRSSSSTSRRTTASPRCSRARSTCWSATRRGPRAADGAEGATFLQPTFYDGQGMMVAADSGIDRLDDLAGQVVCVAGGTTTRGQRRHRVRPARPRRRPRCCRSTTSTCSSRRSRRAAATAGRRTAASSPGCARATPTGRRRSRSSTPTPSPRSRSSPGGARRRLAVGPGRRVGDPRHHPGRGVRAHVGQRRREQRGSTDPTIRRSSACEVDGAALDPGLGLPAGLRRTRSSSQVGNYAEIYERNITPLGLDRGLNALWTDGGPALRPALPLSRPTGRRTVDAARPAHHSGGTSASCGGRSSSSCSAVGRGRRRRARRQRPDEQRAARDPDRLRLPRQPGAVPDPRQRLPPDPTGARRARRSGSCNTLRVSIDRHRAGDHARHADRRRPAVAATGCCATSPGSTSRSIRNMPAAADRRVLVRRPRPGTPSRASRTRGSPRASPCISNRGVVVPWFDGQAWALVLAIVVVAVVVGCARGAVAPPRRRPHRPTRPQPGSVAPRRRSPSCSWSAGSCSGSAARPRARRAARDRRHPDEPGVLRHPVRARHLHGEPHRRDRAGVDPGRAHGPGRGRRWRSPCRGFQRLRYVVLPQAFRIAVPPLGNQYLNLTQELDPRRGGQLLRAGQGDVDQRGQRRAGGAVVPAHARHLPRAVPGHLAPGQPGQPPPGPGER